jgi:hypothetical protein
MRTIAILLSVLIQSIHARIIFPPLQGLYPVGTRRIEGIDHDRQDPFAPSPQPRAPMLQLWYPILPNESLMPASWLPPNSSYYLAQELGLPEGTLDDIITGTFVNGTAIFPLAKEVGDKGSLTVPVLFFSPGSGALCSAYSIFLSSLASYGYTIIGIDHPYDSDYMERESGEVVFRDEALNDPSYQLRALLARRDDILWLDAQLTPNYLTKLLSLPSSTFSSSTTLSLGAFGHSFGGTAINFISRSSYRSFQSSASLDAPFFAPLNETGFHGPLLYMGSTLNPCCHDGLLKSWRGISGWKAAVAVRGTTHSSYSDYVAITPQLHGIGEGVPEVGEVEPERMVELVTAYLRDYWKWSLEGEKMSDLLRRWADTFPEVYWEDLKGNGDVFWEDSKGHTWKGLRKQSSDFMHEN